jgi:hypothetical protein
MLGGLDAALSFIGIEIGQLNHCAMALRFVAKPKENRHVCAFSYSVIRGTEDDHSVE